MFNPSGTAQSRCTTFLQSCWVLCRAPADTSTCAAHGKCATAGLEGACCPNPQGKFLDCCDAECSKHSKCSHLPWWQMFCCPTTEDNILDCCSGNTTLATLLV